MGAGLTFPYLYDESQEVARAYGAACTPDIYLYDSRRRLQYHGQFDSSRPGNGKPVTGDPPPPPRCTQAHIQREWGVVHTHACKCCWSPI